MLVGELKKHLEGVGDTVEVIVARSHGNERGSSLTWSPSMRIYQKTRIGNTIDWQSCHSYEYTQGRYDQYLIEEPLEVLALYIV